MEHDPQICGLSYEDSCPRCQIGWILSPERAGEIPLEDLRHWAKEPRQCQLTKSELAIIERLLTERNLEEATTRRRLCEKHAAIERQARKGSRRYFV